MKDSMPKFNENMTKVKEKVKAAFEKFPFIPIFIGWMFSVILAAHFFPYKLTEEVAQVKPEVVSVAPEPAKEPARYYPAPAQEVRVITTRAPADKSSDRPIVVEIHQIPAPVPVTPEPSSAPKEMPEHLKLTPENIARMQNINRADGATDEFDVDFDQEPEKEVKK